MLTTPSFFNTALISPFVDMEIGAIVSCFVFGYDTLNLHNE